MRQHSFLPATFLLLSLLLGASCRAQVSFSENHRPVIRDLTSGLLAPSPTRNIVDLHGSWEYTEGSGEAWFPVRVPSSYSGRHELTFRRSFNIDPQLARRSVFQIVALNISYYSEIRINGQFVGKHAGSSSFSFKIAPGVIKAGKNTITIVVNNFLNAKETVPSIEQFWRPIQYGGIIHDVAIIASGPVWVQETEISTTIAGDFKPATITYKALLNSGTIPAFPADTSIVRGATGRILVDHFIEVVDQNSGQLVARSEPKRVEVESDRLVQVDLSLTLPSVRLWSVDATNLYMIKQRTVRGGVVVDESSQVIGFRKFTASQNGFELNGNPMFLKAVTYVEDSPIHGRSVSMDEMERDVLLMKNIGANAVRLVNAAVHPFLFQLCDKYGLLVFQDLPIEGVPSPVLRSGSLQTTAKNMLRELNARDGNQPSFVAWGLAQTVDGSAEGYEQFFSSLAGYLEGRNNQLLYATFATPPRAVPEDIDFIGVDIYPSSIPKTKAVLQSLASSFPERSIFVSMLSYPIEVGNYNGYSDPRSIDAQGQFYFELFLEARARKLHGITIHSLADWEVSYPILSVDRVHQFSATTGILDRYRYKRISYDVLKARFNNEKPPVLVVGDFEEPQPSTFVIVGILLILLFALVYNLFRRFRENVSRSILRPYNFYADVRDQRMLSVFQTLIVGLIGSISAALVMANLMYFWRTNIFFDRILSLFVHSVGLKQWLNYAAWNPLSNILAITLLLFLLLLLYSVVVRIVAFFLKRKLVLFDTYSVAMWSVLPMVFLSPAGMVLHRLMYIPALEWLSVAGILLFHLWILFRLLKGTSIVLDIRPGLYYVIGYGLLVVMCAVWLLSLDSRYETFAYLRYVFDVWSFLYSLPA